ncbi:MAG: EexN family lipoprotein [Woeseiaceae bacterium]|nr:EexN family lipoprotein [Woeseiaceae bacterium]
MNKTAMLTTRTGWFLAGAALIVIAGCGKEPPPPTVSEFVDNPILLEATIVRCRENRVESRYEAECVNAREAANRVEAAQTEARRAELEAQSEQKRQALRRAQEAAAEARRRAAEAERLLREAELLGQYETVGEGDGAAPPEGSGVSQPESAEPVPDGVRLNCLRPLRVRQAILTQYVKNCAGARSSSLSSSRRRQEQ